VPSERSESLGATAAGVVAAEADAVPFVGSGSEPLPQAATNAKISEHPSSATARPVNLAIEHSSPTQNSHRSPATFTGAEALLRHPCAQLRANLWSAIAKRPLLVAFEASAHGDGQNVAHGSHE
jgi:hypothetical protein